MKRKTFSSKIRNKEIIYIEHPSDIGFEVSGKTLENLFSNAALATYGLMTDPDSIPITHRRFLSIKSEDLKALMFDWISELLLLFDSESLVLSDFEIRIEQNNMYHLSGKCGGGHFHPEKHVSGIIVKAVTYHMMSIYLADGVWKARVIVDV